jgi:hypothetical protein
MISSSLRAWGLLQFVASILSRAAGGVGGSGAALLAYCGVAKIAITHTQVTLR